MLFCDWMCRVMLYVGFVVVVLCCVLMYCFVLHFVFCCIYCALLYSTVLYSLWIVMCIGVFGFFCVMLYGVRMFCVVFCCFVLY